MSWRIALSMLLVLTFVGGCSEPASAPSSGMGAEQASPGPAAPGDAPPDPRAGNGGGDGGGAPSVAGSGGGFDD